MKKDKLILMAALVSASLLFSACSENSGTVNKTAAKPAGKSEKARVYYTSEISSQSLIAIYKALGREARGNVAVKLSMGEPGGNNYLKPALVGDFVRLVNGTFIDANTAYGGRRSTTEQHLQTARDHGFAAIAPVDILDAEGEIDLPVVGGKHLKRDVVGSHFTKYDFVVNLSHFKGHAMGGFGGALKNMSIGIASVSGKCLIHTAGASSTNAFEKVEQNHFLESMAEAAKAIADHCGENIIYISVMNNLSVDCDCDASPEDPKMGDIGILASLDPVALDKACVDLVYASKDHGKIHLIERMESRNGIRIVEHAEQIGMGTTNYELVNLSR
ncbi:putative Fe-S center protein [Ereboglobus sp. PH5-5]|uniref:DUF362 domain-containing protein n=1 Tax=unclassified Ereboglobus TaxID=2626932 RepID=UPI002405CC54|nr:MULTISPECIES: DUF362 domain-containing protein [unclassified Ereboglobus]MDF9827285.1 putative Fe-S center protein [Ereboglobus sp. PH5-10]MDF9833762.1 putative Fe-S center protein [Ereboglobus sp. PH5-5]